MPISPHTKQTIYNAVRVLLNIPKSHGMRATAAKATLHASLKTVVVFGNRLPKDIIEIFIKAFLTNQYALYYVRTQLEQRLQSLHHQKSTAEHHNKKTKLSSHNAATPEEEETGQEVNHDPTDSAETISKLTTEIATVDQNLKIVVQLYQQELQISKGKFDAQRILDFFSNNTHIPTLMFEYLHCKAYTLIQDLGFVVLASEEELLQAAREYLQNNIEETRKAFIACLETHVQNDLLPLHLVRLIVLHMPNLCVDTPTDGSCDDHIYMGWLDEPAEFLTRIDKSKLDFVLKKIIGLGFVFEQSRVNSRESTPAADVATLAEPIMPTPDQTPEPEVPATVSSGSTPKL